MRVLCVGVATLDIVNTVASYPPEDSEVRATAQSQRLGGNAANTAVVLAQLGVDVAWAGSLAPDTPIIDTTFRQYGIDTSPALRHSGGVAPTSYVTLSEASGTRSIVHHRDLPEYSAEGFMALDLSAYDWIHFEGRAVDQLAAMLRRVRQVGDLPVSLEVEKPRQGIEALFDQADLLLFSHAYARARGFADAESLLCQLPDRLVATCTWGARGAWAAAADGQVLHAPAPQLPQVVDTLGAGDVFNAAMVFERWTGKPLAQALTAAVALASLQCTRPGLALAAVQR